MQFEHEEPVPNERVAGAGLGVFEADLHAIADHNGVPFGRLQSYWQEESRHLEMMQSNNPDTLLVVRAYQCLFLETAELLNASWTQPGAWSQLDYYKSHFVPRMVIVFKQIGCTDLMATHGYPLPAYAMLRNVFDSLVLISAVMQRITDFPKIEGEIPGVLPTDKKSRELRKNAEREARRRMIGMDSGLPADTREKLALLDDMFDLEVHGARFSHATAAGWVVGTDPLLPLVPEYQSHLTGLYEIRQSEIAWMAHRLLPLLQHSALTFPDAWKDSWRILDCGFEAHVRRLTDRQESKSEIPTVAFVKCKFPFGENTRYPLEGLETTR